MAKSSTITAKKPAPAAASRKSTPAAKSSGKGSPVAPAKPAKVVVAPAAKGKPPVVAKGISAAVAKGVAAAPKAKPAAKLAPPPPGSTAKANSGKSASTFVGAPPRVIVAVPANKPAVVAVPTKVNGKNGKHVSPVVSAKPGKTVEVKASKSADRPKNGSAHPPVPAPPPRPIPEAVPTDGKPRKNQAGLNVKDLEHFRSLLLEKRRELVGDMVSMESEALRTSGGTNLSNLPLHMADMGTDNYEQEFTLVLVEKDRTLLREINGAMAKIQNGTYGICEGTGKPIMKVRLEAQPWARFSIEHARSLERRIR